MFVPKVSEYQTTGAGAGVSFSQFMSASSLSSRFDGFSSDLAPIDETLHEQRGIHYFEINGLLCNGQELSMNNIGTCPPQTKYIHEYLYSKKEITPAYNITIITNKFSNQ